MRFQALIIALLSIATPALAQDCQPIEQMKGWLASEYQETHVGGGISLMDRAMVLLFSKADGSTFTVVKVNPKGTACIVDVGEDWQVRNDPAPAVGEGL